MNRFSPPARGSSVFPPPAALKAPLGKNHHLMVLEIIGDGPQRSALEKMAAAAPSGRCIRFLGQLAFVETQRRLGGAWMLIIDLNMVRKKRPSTLAMAFGGWYPERHLS